MSRRDLIHDSVRKALENDGWTITDDPLVVEIDDGDDIAKIDLGAEKVISAEKGGEKIAVEIKSFRSSAILHTFGQASGQYLLYELVLEKKEPDRTLYLAVPEHAYLKMQVKPTIQDLIQIHRMNLIVIDTDNQMIVQWV